MVTLIIALLFAGGGFAGAHYGADIGIGWSVAIAVAVFAVFQVVVGLQLKKRVMKDMEKMLGSCMLCGKCTLVCPRGVNLRSLIINMRQILSNTTEILG